MRHNFGVHPWTYPQPVFMIATYAEDGTSDLMPLTWGGVNNEKELGFYISEDHQTTRNILARKALTVSMAEVQYIAACNYVGMVSGKKITNKVEKAGFHTHKAEFVDAPMIEELSLTLECRLISYDAETCRMRVEIVNVSADEKILVDGKIDPQRLAPVTFDTINNAYLALGEKVGDIFSEGKNIL